MSSTAEPQRLPQQPRTLRELLDAEFMAKLDQLDVVSRKIFAGKLKGERRSKRRGTSVEFADYRNYVVGDDLRFIDWNIYGRLDRLFLKLFLEEEDLCLHVVVDASASMDTGDPLKSWAARRVAAALGYIGLANYNRVTATVFAEGVVGQVSNLRGRHRLEQLGRLLIHTPNEGGSDLVSAARHLARTRQGKGVMVIVSDFLAKTGYEQALRYLVGNRYDVYLLQVLSPQEIDPPLTGDLRLIDVEDGDLSEVSISAPLLKRYKANLESYCEGIKEFCSRRGAVYTFASSDVPFDRLILDYLRRRGLLK
jgi:uncharacterized protein (DUF58 family)